MTATASHIVGIFAATASGEEHWVQLVPLGQFQGKDGRGPFTLADRKAAETVINATLRHHGEADIVIDYDHQSDFAAKAGVGGQAPAAGWITEMAVRNDGLWGRVEWTEPAAAKLRVREYRYLSPVFSFDKKNGAIQKILRAGLTNNPNLHLKAVASADMSNPDHLAELRSIFGLSEAAGLDAIVEAARARSDTAVNTVNLSRFVPIEALEKVTVELNRLTSLGVSAEAAEIAVNTAIERGIVPPALKDWGISLCQHDRAAFDAFVTRTSGVFAHLNKVNDRRVQSDAVSTHSATGVEAEVAQQLGLKAEEMKA